MTHSNCSKEPLWHISHHDSHEEDHGFQEGISDEHGNHKEGEPKKDRETGNDVNKVFDFYGNGCLLVADTTRQAGNPTDDGTITCVDDHTSGNTWRGERRVYSDVLKSFGDYCHGAPEQGTYCKSTPVKAVAEEFIQKW